MDSQITLHCLNCNDKFTEVYLFPCYHNFCLKCTNLMKNGAKTTCLFCFCKCHQDEIKRNLFLEKICLIKKNLKQKNMNKSYICEICGPDDDTIQADKLCVDCDQYMCEKCSTLHVRSKISSKHIIVDKNEKEDQAFASLKLKCEKHKKSITSYCKECDMLMCQDCCTSNHYNHDKLDNLDKLLAKLKLDGSQKEQDNYKIKLKEKNNYSSEVKYDHLSENVAKVIDETKITPLIADRAFKSNKMPTELIMSIEISNGRVRKLNPVWGESRFGLTGLKNLGNTCYLNVIIQCLSNTVPFSVYFLCNHYLQDLKKEKNHSHYIVQEFVAVLKALWSSLFKVISPIDFQTSIFEMNSMFATSNHHDAQKFLQQLLSAFHDALNKGIKKSLCLKHNNKNLDDEVAAEISWKTLKDIDNSIIVDMCTGQYKSDVKCLTCYKNSIVFKNFTCLTLQIPTSLKCHLSDCLERFSKEERITWESQWHCPYCMCTRDASKRIVIWRLPKILIIHLNRFHYEGNKITTNVSFPIESFDLNRYASSIKYLKQPYDLFAVANHYGNLDGGYYDAFCKNQKLNRWFKFVDSDVSELNENSIQTSAAYLLFYSSIEMKMNWV